MNKNEPYKNNKIDFNKAREVKTTNLPFDKQEIRSLLESGDTPAYRNKYKQLFKNHRRWKMFGLASIILIVTGLFVGNLFNTNGVTTANNQELTKHNFRNQTSKNLSSNEIDKESNKEKNKGEVEKSTVNEDDQIFKLVVIDSNKRVYALDNLNFKLTKCDTAETWELLGYNSIDDQFYFVKSMIYQNKKSGKEQVMQYKKDINKEFAINVYKELLDTLKFLKFPQIEKIGFLQDDTLSENIILACTWHIYKIKDANIDLLTKILYKFVYLSNIINNQSRNRLIDLKLTKEELIKFGIFYSDSSMYYYTESLIESVSWQFLKGFSIVDTYKPEQYPFIAKILHNNIIFRNPEKSLGTIIIETRDTSAYISKYNFFQKYKEKNILVKSEYLLPSEKRITDPYNPISPIFINGENDGAKYYFSPMTKNNKIFDRFNKANLQKTLLDGLEDVIFRDSLSEASYPQMKNKLKYELQSSQIRIMLNYLIPIKVNIPYIDSVNSVDFIQTEYLWFLPTPEFIEALPERYREVLKKEMKAIELIEAGKMEPEQACKGLEPEQTFFEVCKLASESMKMVNLVPNPVIDNANLKFMLLEDRYVNITIHDQNGNFVQSVLNWEKLKSGEQNFNISMSNLLTGTYVISIITDKSEKVIKRFVKI